MRGNQSPFTNVSIYDDNFLDKLCGDYIFPDGSSPDKELIKKIQNLYLNIMNREMERTPITFPVTTACFSINDEHEIQDEEFVDFISEKNLKFAFINIYIGKSSTLSSCCRLRSEQNNEYFNSFGSGSSKIGSLGVCTINLPRLAIRHKNNITEFKKELEELVELCARINNAKRKIVQRRIDNGNHPLYSLGFIDINTQYNTCGINGFNEAISYLGEDILEEEGVKLGIEIIECINSVNDKMQKRFKTPHNCEQIPGEGTACTLPVRDKLLGLNDKYDMYSNQFIPLVERVNMFDRIRMQGLFDKHFSGGAICHLNMDQDVQSAEVFKNLIIASAKEGVVYFAINLVLQECDNHHMTVGRRETCPICGEPITGTYTRVVGFLSKVNNWVPTRREKDFPNRQFYKEVETK